MGREAADLLGFLKWYARGAVLKILLVASLRTPIPRAEAKMLDAIERILRHLVASVDMLPSQDSGRAGIKALGSRCLGPFLQGTAATVIQPQQLRLQALQVCLKSAGKSI